MAPVDGYLVPLGCVTSLRCWILPFFETTTLFSIVNEELPFVRCTFITPRGLFTPVAPPAFRGVLPVDAGSDFVRLMQCIIAGKYLLNFTYVDDGVVVS